MDYLQVILASLISAVALFLLTRVLGYRQISELSMFDYVNSITIGSIAAELAISKGTEMLLPLVAMVIYTGFTLLLSLITDHSIKMRRLAIGKPVTLLEHGKIYDRAFSSSRLDINEFTEMCRAKGYFDITRIDTAILEANGTLSILPLSDSRPATPADLSLPTTQENIPAIVIMDGKVMSENLKNIGFDEIWLLRRLREQGYGGRLESPAGKNRGENAAEVSGTKDIFLAVATPDGMLSVYRRHGKKERDILE